MSHENPKHVRPDLPSDILYTIFQQGSRQSTQLAYNLCLVSYWVRDIALPGLYSFASLQTEGKANKFVETIKKGSLMARPGSNAFKPNVPALQLRSRLMRAVSVFTQCLETVTHLAISGATLYQIMETRLQANGNRLKGRLHNLDIFLFINFDDATLFNLERSSWYYELCLHITRLRLPEVAYQFPIHPKTYNRLFTSLTHISFPIKGEDIDLIVELMDHPNLKLITLLVSDPCLYDLIREDSDKGWLQKARINNRRNIRISVIKTPTDAQSLLQRWEAEVRGEESIWDVEE